MIINSNCLSQTRIVRLMEAKPDTTRPDKRTKMIDVYYDRDAAGNQGGGGCSILW